MDSKTVDDVFGEPRSLTDVQVHMMRGLQQAYLDAARSLVRHCPDSPDRDKALDLLRQSKMIAEGGVRTGRPILSRDTIIRLFTSVEAEDKRVSQVWLNAHNFADVRKFCGSEFDPSGSRELLKRGLMGRLWGADVYASRKIPQGWAKLVSDDDKWDMPESGPTEAELVPIFYSIL